MMTPGPSALSVAAGVADASGALEVVAWSPPPPHAAAVVRQAIKAIDKETGAPLDIGK
jgi:hypothetical protein